MKNDNIRSTIENSRSDSNTTKRDSGKKENRSEAGRKGGEHSHDNDSNRR